MVSKGSNKIDARSEGISFLNSEAFREEADLVRRIVSTPSFVRSTFLTNFLSYVCDRKLRGLEDEITEYQIGIYAFGRPDSFNTGEDNIVRNYARILRKRLEEYFATEGRHEHMRIVIPRGHYVPVFEANPLSPVNPPENLETESPQFASQSVGSSVNFAEGAPRRFKRWHIVAAALLLAAGIATPIYLAIHARSRNLYNVFWKELLDQDRPTYIVTGDSGFAMLQDITGRELRLEDYVMGDWGSRFPSFNLAQSSKNGLFGPDRFSNYTSTADLSIAISIMRRAQPFGEGTAVRFARDMRMEDLKRSNVILIGGPHANPWVELFEPMSNFRMYFPMHVDGSHLDERSFINKHPRPGEQASYSNMTGHDSYWTYTLVSFLPSIDGKGHALLTEGQNMAGTQAAGDFVLDQSAMNPILTKARLPDGSVGPFEVLLQTRTVGANAPEAQVVVERFGFVRTAE